MQCVDVLMGLGFLQFDRCHYHHYLDTNATLVLARNYNLSLCAIVARTETASVGHVVWESHTWWVVRGCKRRQLLVNVPVPTWRAVWIHLTQSNTTQLNLFVIMCKKTDMDMHLSLVFTSIIMLISLLSFFTFSKIYITSAILVYTKYLTPGKL